MLENAAFVVVVAEIDDKSGSIECLCGEFSYLVCVK